MPADPGLPLPWQGHFFAGEKKPAEAGFFQDHYDFLSIAILARSIVPDPEHSLCFSG